jgi:hypothetical protein
MQFSFSIVKRARVVKCVRACAFALLLSSCIHKKYETPIAKNTQQPDKILFDAAMKDIEHGRYEVARISLQTLMNTYESSEFLAKAAPTAWVKRKPNTKTSNFSIHKWKKPRKRKIAFATSTTSRWIRAIATLFKPCALKPNAKI